MAKDQKIEKANNFSGTLKRIIILFNVPEKLLAFSIF